ncbi:hypothetical protein BHE97_15730 [Aeromicrobium sp. PE09-221]|uniref:hypothetical protein n=1 Tax=Aeromicrobium sp. PE09-221 TaxID=1898043 RepID=UPI000B3E548F|nr:hypothetical protein [Aeromicrobium sp. PE09-221]OUZ07826.1 hypothetical protein BHE97_15730 [Aeromicrobium sp. PE09-221]
MTEAQTWTLIATFIATFFGTLTLFGTMMTRVIRAEVGGLRSDMGSMETRINAKIDALDRDVQAIARRALP